MAQKPRAPRQPKAAQAAKAPHAATAAEGQPTEAPATEAAETAEDLSQLDHDRDGQPGGSLPDGYHWSEPEEHGDDHPAFILEIATGARVADTAEELRAILDGSPDPQGQDPQGDGEASDAPVAAGDVQGDASPAEDASGARTEDEAREELDLDDLQVFRPAFAGQTVMFREHNRRFGGLTTTPAIITQVYDDLVVNLMVLANAGEPYSRLAVPFEQVLDPEGRGRAWSFINV